MQRWSDRDVGRDLDLEWELRTNPVASDDVYSLLGCDICFWVDICQAGQVGDLESDKYVGAILTDNLIVCVCVCMMVINIMSVIIHD